MSGPERKPETATPSDSATPFRVPTDVLVSGAARAPAFDWDEARGRMAATDALLAELAELFLADCPHLLADADKAWAERRLTDLQRVAHTLKGSASVFVATPLQEAARLVEFAARTGDGLQLPRLLAGMRAECDRLLPDLAARARAFRTPIASRRT